MANLTDALTRAEKTRPVRKTIPVWGGPEKDGITFSLLSRFLVDRERFRLLVVEGLKPVDRFNAKMEFGNMWHLCEEAFAAGGNPILHSMASAKPPWHQALLAYTRELMKRYMSDKAQIEHWYNIIIVMFPRYMEFWKRNPDVKARTPLLQEEPFNVAYTLPSGRTVRLRGKWDAVDLIGKGKAAGIWNQENKSKSSIDQEKLTRQLSYDLQTMMYLIALTESDVIREKFPGQGRNPYPIKGVRYNVIRRPAHKSTESLIKKMDEDFGNNRAGEWFARWDVAVSQADINRFKHRTLDPILEQLCDWWKWIQMEPENPFRLDSGIFDDGGTAMHWQHPFGVYNVLDEGGASDLDYYLLTGSEVGLQRTDDLFPELQPQE
jgi:hypothetical protein